MGSPLSAVLLAGPIIFGAAGFALALASYATVRRQQKQIRRLDRRTRDLAAELDSLVSQRLREANRRATEASSGGG